VPKKFARPMQVQVTQSSDLTSYRTTVEVIAAKTVEAGPRSGSEATDNEFQPVASSNPPRRKRVQALNQVVSELPCRVRV